MNKRMLGRTGFEIAPLALGGNVFGWTADEPTSFTVLDAFVCAGFDLVDTADSYRAGSRAIEAGNRKRSSAAGSHAAAITTTC